MRIKISPKFSVRSIGRLLTFQLNQTLRGGRSKAFASCSKFPLWEESQKGLLLERPHRQSVTAVLPCRPYTFPSLSVISKSPSTRKEPLLFTVIFVDAIVVFFRLTKIVFQVVYKRKKPGIFGIRASSENNSAFFITCQAWANPSSRSRATLSRNCRLASYRSARTCRCR